MSKESELKAIQTATTLILKSIGTIQSGVQDLLINSTLYAFKYKGEGSDVIAKVMNSLTSVKGSFRVESVGYWYTQVAGLDCKFSKDKWSVSYAKDSYISDLGVSFDYDAAHLAKCKALPFWTVAPVTIKELKLATDPEKTTQSAEIMLARALAGNSMNPDEVKAHLANMYDRIIQLSTNGKTKEWLNGYYLQHPDQKPTTIVSAEDAELVELFEAERLGGLEA